MTVEEPVWYRNLKGICCGTTGGIAVTLVGHPFDTLKVRLQTQCSTSPTYNGVIDCLKKTIKWEGVGGLYKGVGSPLVGQIFFRTSLFTAFYESLNFFQKRSQNIYELSDYFKAGLVTGFLVSFTDSPIDLFKSKMQYQIIAEKNNIPLTVRYRSVFHCLQHTVSQHGIRGVYQGLGATLARDIPGYALFFGKILSYLWCVLLATDGQKPSEIGMFKIMFAAGMGGISFWTSTYNIDVIKSAMMADDIDVNKRKYKNMIDCAKQLYHTQGGYSRFWKGYGPCIMRAFLANAVMLYIVDVTRKIFPTYSK